jgi:hypothetical protein
VNHFTRSLVHQNVGSVAIADSQDVPNDARHRHREAVLLLRHVPRLHRVPESLDKEVAEARRKVKAHLVEDCAFLFWLRGLHHLATFLVNPVFRVVARMQRCSFGWEISFDYRLRERDGILNPFQDLEAI